MNFAVVIIFKYESLDFLKVRLQILSISGINCVSTKQQYLTKVIRTGNLFNLDFFKCNEKCKTMNHQGNENKNCINYDIACQQKHTNKNIYVQ